MVWVDYDDGHAGGYPHECDEPLLKQPEPCVCGHRCRWRVETEPTQLEIDLELLLPNGKASRLEFDVVERPCPHRNGTVIQYCPNCDRQVGMWGCGPAGGMECDCWND